MERWIRARRPLENELSTFSGDQARASSSLEAADTPEVLGELIDQNLFDRGCRLMLAAERSAQVIELSGIFAGKNELLRIGTVLEGVLRRPQFAGSGFGSGGSAERWRD